MESKFHPYRILAKLWAIIGRNVSDRTYLKIRYPLIMRTKFHIDDPKTFNEKINWLKIYYRNPKLINLVDKAEVKEIVKHIIGKDKIIPTYGVWDRFEDIDFEKLPNQFVLKSTNGGGGTGVIVCRDKQNLDLIKAKAQLEKSTKTDFRISREWVYYDVKPRFIAEALMTNTDGSALVDYKIMCFNGEPKLLFYASDRYAGKNTLKFDWYDMELNHLPIISHGYENANKTIEYFPQWEDMKALAKKLAQYCDVPCVRVDFYLINGKIYFGELTFFHDGGFVPLEPVKWEYELGSWINLPEKFDRRIPGFQTIPK